MEYWSDRVLEYWKKKDFNLLTITPSLQYSNTPNMYGNKKIHHEMLMVAQK